MTYTAEHISLKRSVKAVFHRYRAAFCAFISFSAGVILSAAADHGACVNNGVALVGAFGAGIQGVASLIGCVLGYSAFFGFDQAATYIAASVVIYTISFVCQYSPIYKTRFFAVINVSLVLGITSAFNAVSTLRGDHTYYLELILEMIRGFIMTYAYQISMKSSHHDLTYPDVRRWICILISASSIVSSCVGFSFLGISVGRILYFLALLMIVPLSDPFLMCLTAVIFSFAVSYFEQETIVYICLSVLHTVSCMMFGVRSKKGSAFILLAAVLVFSFVNTTDLYRTLFELGIAVILFCLFPTGWFRSLRLYLNTKNNDQTIYGVAGPDDGRVHIADLLTNISVLLKSDNEYPNTPIDTIEVFGCAVDRVCNVCEKKDICWENHHNELLNMFFELKTKAERRGKLIMEDFPEWFSDYCHECEMVFMEINYELRNRAEKHLYATRMKQKNDIMCDMLQIISDIALRSSDKENAGTVECKMIENKVLGFLCNYNLECSIQVTMIREGVVRIELQGKSASKVYKTFHYIEELSKLLNMRLRVMKEESKKNSIVLYNAEPYAVSVGVATKKKTGEQVCGDCYSYFKTEEGVFYVILSDGLGTGSHAEKQSKFLTCLLEQLIINNLKPLEAVQLASMIISLNNGELWNCATIDMFCLDLYTGDASIYKVGAAPSYLNRKNKLCEISESIVHVEDLTTEPIQVFHEKFLMEPEDTFIVMSDGVVIDNKEMLKETICKEEDSMKILARTVLLNSQMNDSLDDDMTVITVKMEHRV